jgi:ATP-binding protein involved in chromosome partitioning
VQPDGTVLDVFGSGGGRLVAERLSTAAPGEEEPEEVPLLGSVPLSPSFREAGDRGEPAVLGDPRDPAAAEVLRVARRVIDLGRGLAGRPLGIAPR